MKKIFINKEIAQLILLQRIDLANPLISRIRKLFGRKFFTKFVSKYLIIPSRIGQKYLEEMELEYKNISDFVNFDNKNILSIGPGVGGLELIIDKYQEVKNFFIIDKNYISEKIIYGWDSTNSEAYNNLDLVGVFLKKNGVNEKKINLIDFDKDKLPIKDFDIIISLFSLDYHYSFDFYQDYFKKIINDKTIIIFDTVRPEYFEKLFSHVKIIKIFNDTVHKSSRIMCSKMR